MARFNRVYRDRRWQPVRRRVLDRDGWRCVRCRRYGSIVHHRQPLHLGGAPFDPANLETVCRDCHADIHADLRQASSIPGREDFRAAVRGLVRQRSPGGE